VGRDVIYAPFAEGVVIELESDDANAGTLPKGITIVTDNNITTSITACFVLNLKFNYENS
jgi:hypothetical protein